MRLLVKVVASLVALLVTVGTGELMAQHTYKFRDSLGTYTVRFKPHNATTTFIQSPTRPHTAGSHELRLSTSWGATDWFLTPACRNELYYHGNELTSYYSGPSHYYTMVFEYGYWATEWLNVGVNATWLMGMRNMYDNISHQRLRTIHEDDISIMPMARFAWYNRSIMQLYSSVAIGLGIERDARGDSRDDVWHDYYCAFDCKLLGISVGRKWFGFAEIGYGARGMINVGFGCRINTKVR